MPSQDRKHLTEQEAANLSWDNTYDVFAIVGKGYCSATSGLVRIAIDADGKVKVVI